MKKTIFIIISGLIFLLSGCATPYQKYGALNLRGGYVEEQAPGNLIKISFYRNMLLSDEKTEEYIFFRCAQIGKENGKPYFALYNSLMDAVNNKKINELYMNHFPGLPASSVYVQYHNENQPGDLSVDEIYDRYKIDILGK